jgi:glycosyltransferase involved in cell wall biosynthesis
MKDACIMVVAHVLVHGPAYDLVKYLLPRTSSLAFLTHPLRPFDAICENVNTWTLYHRGMVVRRWRSVVWRLPRCGFCELILYAKDFLLTLWMGWVRMPSIDLWVGVNPLNALAGIVLKRMGKVRRVVFYVIDFVPQRFPNRWLNRFYHALDRFCVRSSDFTWNLSSRMAEERQRRGLPPQYRARQITVPIGTELVQPLPDPDQVERYAVVYMGGLLEKQGVHLAIQAMPIVCKEIPQARLYLYGGGPYEEPLRAMATQLGLDGVVRFEGVIRDHGELLRRIARCAVALAPYPDVPENFTRYTDPGKPKAYLSAGLPVILTDVPEVAQQIEQAGCGLVVKDDPDSIAQAILKFLKDDLFWRRCREQTKVLAQSYRWESVFETAFRAMELL